MYDQAMSNPPATVITRRGQTVVPAAVRRRHGLHDGSRLVWLDDGETIRVVPVPDDPLKALRGIGRGEGLLAVLLQERHEEAERQR